MTNDMSQLIYHKGVNGQVMHHGNLKSRKLKSIYERFEQLQVGVKGKTSRNMLVFCN